MRVEINAVLVATSDSRHIRNGSGMRNRRFKRWILLTMKFEICVFAFLRISRKSVRRKEYVPSSAKTQKRKKKRLSVPSLYRQFASKK